MKKIYMFILLAVFIAHSFVFGMIGIKKIGSWEFPDRIFGKIFYSTVDKDNHLVVSFYKIPVLSMSSKGIVEFAPYGQGPNELTNLVGMCFYKGNLALAEHADKIKIYEKKKGKYVWKETKWLKHSGYYALIPNCIKYYENKWFVVGTEGLEYNKITGKSVCSHIKVYDEKGKMIKRLIKSHYTGANQYPLMSRFIPMYKRKLFFITENSLELSVVSIDKLKVERKIQLSIPGFYKKMPKDFYVNNPNENNFMKNLEKWNTGYSSITNVLVSGKYLILQIRTCNDEMKKFAILFYNADNFKLKKTYFTDDYLMGVRENKLYCFMNGNPGLDDDTDDAVINIYKITEK